MKLLKFIIVLFVTCFSAEAQEYELGEVTKEELEEKSHPSDPSAAAAILFSKGRTYRTYSKMSVTEVEMKIKIYTKEGYEWANKIIPYYSDGSAGESVEVSKAVTYNLEEGAIKKSKLKSEGELDERVNKYWKQKKIVMPDVREGCIIEYKYTIEGAPLGKLPDWQFQEAIPVDHSELTTIIADDYIYNTIFRGYYVPKVTKDKKQKFTTDTWKVRSSGLVSNTTFSTDRYDYFEDHITYLLDNLPAMKEEAFVNNIRNYTASVEHELSAVKRTESFVKTFSGNWVDLANTIYKYEDFGPELEKAGYFNKDIDALLKDVTSPTEKYLKVFSYVKNRMAWNGYYGYLCNDGVKKAYNEKVGNVADINLMLTAMLRYAGLTANPVLVSTRSNKLPLYPDRAAFNYVIAAVEIDGKVVLLDATSKSAMPNILPLRALNWTGRLIRKDGTSKKVDLIPQAKAREVMNISVQLGTDGNMKGKARNQYFDHNAYVFREDHDNVGKESCIEKIEKKYKGLEIGAYDIADDKTPEKPVIEEYDFSYTNISDIVGDKIYFSPMLFFTQQENPFRQEKRDYPIDITFPYQDKYFINIKIPEGYVVESLPASVSIVMEEGLGSFKYNIGVNSGQIQIGAVLDMDQAVISQDHYLTIKDFFRKMIEKQNEKVVLKKA